MSAPVLPKGHEEFSALAVAWAIDALEPADQERFEAHRTECDDCERTVRDALEVAAELAYGVPDIAPPPSLRLRLMSAVAPESPSTEVPSEHLHAPAPGIAGRTVADPDREPTPARPHDADPAVDRSTDPERPSSSETSPGRPEETGPVRDRADADPGRVASSDTDRLPDHSDDDPAARYGRHAATPLARTPGFGADGWRAETDAGHLLDRDGQHGGRPRTVPALRRSRRRLVSVFAAAALVGLSAVTTWQATRPAPVSAPIASGDRVAPLTSTDGNRAVATVVVRDGRVDVVTDGLPTTTATTAYYVWGVPAGDAGIPQVLGTFEVTEEGLHSYPVRLTRAIGDYPVLAVSQEATGSTPTTPSDVLARGAFS